MTRKQKAGILAVIGGMMLFNTVVFTIIYVVTSFIYQRTNQQPSALLSYLINIWLGFFFLVLIMITIGRFAGAKQRSLRGSVFAPIFEAMAKIAKGDFQVRLEDKYQDDGIIGELSKSVNNMALELDRMEQMRQEFISNVSHELQSPLTSIRGFAKALQNDQLDSKDRVHYLTIIEAESTRLSRITENLLKLASLEAQQVNFAPKPYRLDRQIRTLIVASEPQWTAKALDIDTGLEEVTITADEDLLSQVWINLISNSIKFTPDGGKVCINLCQQTEKVIFKIADTGIGISADEQNHIFERFYKADKSRTHANNSGSGLGLSIVQKIVGLHHGTIDVESVPGKGTSFIVSLPQ